MGERDLNAEAESVIQPWIILPSQLVPNVAMTGERKLMFAVLEDALRVIANIGSATRGRAYREAKEAAKWVHARGEGTLFAFETICLEFGIDATALRQAVASEEWRKPPRRSPVTFRDKMEPKKSRRFRVKQKARSK